MAPAAVLADTESLHLKHFQSLHRIRLLSGQGAQEEQKEVIVPLRQTHQLEGGKVIMAVVR